MNQRLSLINLQSQSNNKQIGNSLKDFQTLSKLGQGAYGIVYKVKSRLNQQIYVIKRIDLTNLKGKERQKTVKEVEIMQQLEHPNIIKYHNSFLEDNGIVIVMEYIDGGDLSQLISKLK